MRSFCFVRASTTESYTLSLHDALPISPVESVLLKVPIQRGMAIEHAADNDFRRSEEHTSEVQSLRHLVCRLLLDIKDKDKRHPRPVTPTERESPREATSARDAGQATPP